MRFCASPPEPLHGQADEEHAVARAPRGGEDGGRVARHVADFVRVPAADG